MKAVKKEAMVTEAEAAEGLSAMFSDEAVQGRAIERIEKALHDIQKELLMISRELGYHELLLTDLVARAKPFASKKEHKEYERLLDKMLATHKSFSREKK